ncbi:insulinoma-associated protein 1b-like [Carassius auratus]|uniref:Insulinoma-associated protein 1b-like n=1 Tax=Carassius auratus TaxID=7957 RepID=A0A6P6R7I2_CARAU|nr:insulinoma-associated protein 1b-like [Carassius auratus]
MPKGFLVKRNKKAALVSYRIRSDDDGGSAPDCQIAPIAASPPAPSASKPDSITSAFPSDRAEAPMPVPVPVHSAKPVRFGNPETVYQALYSPTRPISKEHDRKYFERSLNLGSPVSAESFPTPASLTSLDHHLLFAPVDLKIGTSNSNRSGTAPVIRPGAKRPSDAAERKSSKSVKKPKAIRKLNFEDEVTTSPVLGLKIKEGPVDLKPRTTSGNTNKPLGEFICQLCREEYSDPFSLAQHKCSRIVRVEYRCPECEKVFSCPANLASHRRWHKPRVPNAPKQALQPTKPFPEAFPGDRDSPSPGLSESGSDDGIYDCQHCGKRFKRQAYLRKHILGHQALQNQLLAEALRTAESPDIMPSEDSQSPAPLNLSPADGLGCPACGEKLPNRASLERHLRLLHDDSQAFPCKFCPATFYSSPGLTRHINKCHPTENRQVILLQMPVRNAC